MKDKSLETLFFEAIKSKYPRTIRNYRPDWLKNLSTGKNLELDCYNYDEKKAWEINGAHHYGLKQEIKDNKKLEICKARGIFLKSFWEVSGIIKYLENIGVENVYIRRIKRWNSKKKQKQHLGRKAYYKNIPVDKRYRQAFKAQREETESILRRKLQGSTLIARGSNRPAME